MKRVRPLHDPDKVSSRGTPVFAKGNAANKMGRPKGVPNKMTTLLKDAIIKAAEAVGENRRGKDGLIGYLKWLAKNEAKSFAALMGRVIPLHVVGDIDHNHRVFRSVEDLQEELKERGIPLKTVFPSTIYVPSTRTKQ